MEIQQQVVFVMLVRRSKKMNKEQLKVSVRALRRSIELSVRRLEGLEKDLKEFKDHETST